MNDQVAILIPTYNREKFIGECLENVLKQTYHGIHIIVYNDGSTDGTDVIVKRIQARYSGPHNILYSFDKDNKGIVNGRNILLSLAQQAKCKYACWQDSDDLSHPDRVQLQLNYIKSINKPMVLAGWTPFRGSKPRIPLHAEAASNQEIIFASGFFESAVVPRFREIIRDPTPTTLGGEDVVWRQDLVDKFGQPPELRKLLYYVRRHDERISVWRRNPDANPDWYKRMSARIV